MYQLILVIQVISALCVIILVLLQQGKGATVGAAFGSGASQTVFGSRGAGSFMLKVTAGFATVFFISCLAMSYVTAKQMKSVKQTDVLDSITQNLPAQPATPMTLPMPGQETTPALPAEKTPSQSK